MYTASYHPFLSFPWGPPLLDYLPLLSIDMLLVRMLMLRYHDAKASKIKATVARSGLGAEHKSESKSESKSENKLVAAFSGDAEEGEGAAAHITWWHATMVMCVKSGAIDEGWRVYERCADKARKLGLTYYFKTELLREVGCGASVTIAWEPASEDRSSCASSAPATAWVGPSRRGPSSR